MITLIVNPIAGSGRSKKVANCISERLRGKNLPFRLWETKSPGGAAALAQKASASYAPGDFLLSVGGDGTFLEVLQGAFGSGLPIAAIPAGTGNDFLKSLKIPGDTLQALEHILNARVRRIDIGVINGTLFANECGAGFDVAVLDYARPVKKYLRGLLPYLWGVLQAIFRYRCLPMEIEADGKPVFSGSCLVVSVANGRYIGGGIPISPAADLQSGKLELIVLRSCSRLRMIRYLPGLLSGKILRFQDTVVHCRADRVTVRPIGGIESLRVNIDGEIHPLSHCEFSLHPASQPLHM